MGGLLVQHVGHPVGRGPHPLADLRLARQAAGEADGDVARLIGGDPGGGFDVALAHDRPGLHGRVDLVAGAIEEAGVDEDDPVLHRMDTGRQIGRGAALLVHHPDLDRVPRQPQQVLDRVEQGVGEGALLRPVHLGFDDIDRAFPAVADGPEALEVVQPDQRGDDGVQHAFGCIRSVGQPHGRRRHQVADVAHEQQGPAGQGHGRSVGHRDGPVRVEGAGEGPAALVEGLDQIATHQAQPVAVGLDLVGGVDRGDGILKIDDGRQGRFQHHIGDPRGVVAADGMVAVEDDLDVQAVVAEQPSLLVTADVLAGIAEGDSAVRIAEISPPPLSQRDRLVQERLGPCDDPCPPRGVERPRRRQIAERIGAVECVIQTAPAGIGGVEHEPGVQARHDQLRPGQGGDLGVDVARADGERRRFVDQIADLPQEGLGGRAVMGRVTSPAVPGVDPGLKVVANRQQPPVLRREAFENRGDPGPEGVSLHAGPRQRCGLDEGGQFPGDLQTGARRHRHGTLLGGAEL